MSDLTTGPEQNFPAGWAISGVFSAYQPYWVGLEPATDADIVALVQAYKEGFYYGGPQSGTHVQGEPEIDMGSCVGRYHRQWLVHGEKDNRGGEGSVTYECQYMREAEREAGWQLPNGKVREQGMWYYDWDGNMQKGIPHGYAYTTTDDVHYAVFSPEDGAVGYYFDWVDQLYRPMI